MPIKKFYASIEDKGKSYLFTYDSESEEEAITYFQKMAKLYNGCRLKQIKTL
ncbi:hypothetical protein ABES25_09855 [Bacillus gobiensis]|uniref:hypothetical protein n=1 Tax=Bacillus gobiensis TaxID=1441095 RepID=UPI003D21B6D0